MHRSTSGLRRLVLSGMALALSAGMLGVFPSHALAASGLQYNGTSPATTGCSAAAGTRTIGQAAIVYQSVTIGYVRLRYSPVCATIWSQVVNTSSTSRWMATGVTTQQPGGPGYYNFDYTLGTCANGNAGNSFCIDLVAPNGGTGYGYQVGVPAGYEGFVVGYLCSSTVCTWQNGQLAYRMYGSWHP